MRRRQFLAEAGLTALGVGAAALPNAAQPAEAFSACSARAASEQPKSALQNVLITSAHSALAQAIAAGFAGRCVVRLTSVSEVATQFPFTRCDLSHEPSTRELVRAAGAIVHLPHPLPGATEAERIDYCTRCTLSLIHI